ncbi:unnamed protein product [Schistocephalus solidus]|uniref:Reverse transcriptase domain-containing protein n=1 Tax=Schistocephalus solidus TaxID=70667 RepID=A0A183T9X5_SCHSO|nr:unnamed protein product [Schistocephalus solidus]
MIFATRRLQEKCQEMRTYLYTTFVDLTKAFDTVNRDGLRKFMQKLGCPERFTQIVHQLHDGMTARVTDNGTVSEAFTITNGVKHGCVLAPTLFSLMFWAMFINAYRDKQPGIRIAYRTDGHLLNSRHMQTSTHVSTTTVHDLLFSDDCALNTLTEEDMQRSMDIFTAGCADFGLTIITAKTVFMHQPPPSANTMLLESMSTVLNSKTPSGLRPAAGLRVESPRYSPENQTEDVQGRRLDDTLYAWTVYSNQARKLNHFHLSCLRRIPWYSPVHQTEDVQGRRLDDTPLRSGNLETKLKMYKAVVLTTLLYGVETWTVYSTKPGSIISFISATSAEY